MAIMNERDLRKALLTQYRLNGDTYLDLAKKTQVSSATLTSLFKNRYIKPKTLIKIAIAMGFKVSDIVYFDVEKLIFNENQDGLGLKDSNNFLDNSIPSQA